jgi:phosphohistidine phosphatase
VVAGLGWMGVTLDEIYTSPLTRARQTAEILAAHLPGAPPVKIFEELTPGRDVAGVRAELARRVKRLRVALVGHEPDLGALAAVLSGASRPIPFKKGGVCRIDLDGLASARPGAVIWVLPPKILRKAGQ